MRKILLPMILWLILPICLFGQQHYYTSVSAVVADKSGNPYSDGSWQANLDVSSVPAGTAVTFQHSNSFQQSYSGQMDASGNFSVTLPDNDVIVPVGDTKWKFTFCQHYTTPSQSPAPVCFGLTLTITGSSMDISSQVQAASVPLNPINSGAVMGNLLPSVDNSFNLGSASFRWANLYAMNATLANPLSILSGGTGTNSPALTAGAGISITGSWPNNMITNTGANLTLSNLTNPTSINVPALDFSGAAGLTAEGSNEPITLTPSGAGNVIIGANGLQFPDSTVQTTAATGGAPIVAKVDLTGQTAAISTTTIYTPTANGFYVVWMEGFIEWATGSDSMTSTVDFMQNGSEQSIPNVLNISASTASAARGSQLVLYGQANEPIQYSTSWSSGGAGNSYDIHVRVQQME